MRVSVECCHGQLSSFPMTSKAGKLPLETEPVARDKPSVEHANLVTKLSLRLNSTLVMFFLFHRDGKQHKARELGMIIRDLECP